MGLFDKKYVWHFYQDNKKGWRWNKRSRANLKIVAAATQGYSRIKGCVENARVNGFKGVYILITKKVAK